MKRLIVFAAVLAGAVCLFLAGGWAERRSSGRAAAASGKKVLYWVDPMHPAYKADKPGIAPDCGMQLEPSTRTGSRGTEKPCRRAPPG